MRKELDEALCAKYPLIFRDRNAPMTDTAMCWGFSCGDGWYDIIDVLCSKLYSHYNQANDRYQSLLETGVGNTLWGTKVVTQEMLDEAKEKMEHERGHVPVAVQVKEKFGGLRFYVNGAIDEHYNYISFAESMSYRTCEECGAPGKRYTDGWHRVLCDVHAEMDGRDNDIEDDGDA
jgi:hypothetical protein